MNKKMFSLLGFVSLAVAAVPFAIKGEAKQAKAEGELVYNFISAYSSPNLMGFAGSCVNIGTSGLPDAGFSGDWATIVDSNVNPSEKIRLLDRNGNPQFYQLKTVGNSLMLNQYAPINYYGYIFEIDAGYTFTNGGQTFVLENSVSYLCKLDNGTEGSWWVTYTPGLSSTKQDVSVEVGKSETLNLSNSAGDTNPIVTWTSSNTDVATVSSNGVVTGVSEGTATIKARVCKEELTYNITVSPASAAQSGIRVKNKVVEVYKGYDFDVSKLNVVTLYGEDEGSKVTVTSEMISGTYDTNTVGEYALTVTSGEFSDTFTLKVVELPAATIANNPGSSFGNNSGWGNFYIVTNIPDRSQYLNLAGDLYNKINSIVLVNGLNNSITGIKNLGGGRYEFWLASALSVGDTITIPAGMPIVQYSGTTDGGTHNPNNDGEYIPVAEVKQNYEFIFTPSGWVMSLATSMEEADASIIEEGSLLANLAGKNSDGTKSALKNVDQTLDTLVYTKDSEGHAARYFSHLEENASASEIRFYLPGNAYKAEGKDTQIYGFSFKYRLVDVNAIKGTEEGSTYEDGKEGTRPASTTTSYMIQYVANSGSKYHCYDANLIADGLEHTFELNVACPSVNGFNIKLFKFQGEIIISDIVAVTVNPAIAGVQAFVDANMHMSETVSENKCVTEGWYTTAKEALNALTAEQRAIFASDAQFATAYSRLQAWAVANGETLSISSNGTVTIASNSNMNLANSNNAALITIIAAMACVTLLGTVLIIRKRKAVK